MKPEQQRIAIAEACGWTYHPHAGGWKKPGEDRADRSNRPPNYIGSLDAINEAENLLSDEVRMSYQSELQRVLLRRYEENSWLVSATSSQRAEAFLRAIGKWVDA